ncbi:hypothetical protein [Lactobacillus taiwanensis]|nr:hypothetical protein [Lactobacillus taiwanensis]
MKYAVVNTLKFGRHTDYENDERLMAVLNKIGVEWIKAENWKEKHELDYRDEDLLAVIDLKNITQLKDLALENKIYIDFKNQVIVPTSYEVDD